MGQEGTPIPEHLLTVSEVADVLRVSGMTVYRLIRRGELVALRIGSNYRIRERDLEDYLESTRVETDPASGQQEAQ